MHNKNIIRCHESDFVRQTNHLFDGNVVLFDKDKNVVRSDNFRGNCKIIDSPFTVKPVEVTETWSNTNDGIQRVFILYDSEGVKYTRTYKYSKI